MRAALVELWPTLAECFGIHPWDVARLSVAEISQYVETLPAAMQRKSLSLG